MRFSKFFYIATVLLMAVAAALFMANIALNLYGQTPTVIAVIAVVVFLIVLGAAFIPDLWPAGALVMAITAKKIARNPNPANIAGLQRSHYYAFCEDILTYPAALSPDFTTAANFGALVTIPADDAFVMVDGKFFHEFPATEETGNIKSTLVGPTDSKAWENVITFGNAGNNDDLIGHIAYIENKPVIIIGRELNGTNKVIGTAMYPARLDSGERDGGTKVADGNTIKHSFRSCSTIPCPTYLGVIPLDPLEA